MRARTYKNAVLTSIFRKSPYWRGRCINTDMNIPYRKQHYSTVVTALALIVVGALSPRSYAGAFQKLLTAVDDGAEVRFTNADLLKNSQISYRAEGGFSEVQSYGVILSCVNGKISVLKSISDPRLSDKSALVHDVSSMSPSAYLSLWDSLDRQAVFRMTDAPEPKIDIADEFTITFNAKIGSARNEFHVVGISRPVAARYYAIRALIDDAVHMKALWNVHSNVARVDQDLIP